MNEAGKFAGAGVVMSAGIAGAAVGGASAAGEATGLVIAATRRAVQAGVEGWDVDGNYVCSSFVFNFQTMEVFDGSETHHIDDIVEARYEDNRFSLYLKGQISPKVVLVGNATRAEAICRLIEAMGQGVVFTPDTKSRHGRVEKRLRLPGIGTFIRYGVRSIFLAIPLWFFLKVGYDNSGDIYFLEYKATVIAIFMLSMAWRLLRPIKTPQWAGPTNG